MMALKKPCRAWLDPEYVKTYENQLRRCHYAEAVGWRDDSLLGYKDGAEADGHGGCENESRAAGERNRADDADTADGHRAEEESAMSLVSHSMFL